MRGTGRIDQGGRRPGQNHLERSARYAECMTVRDLLTELQHLSRDLEVLAFEAGCEDYCEREVDELELQGNRVYLHLGSPPGRAAAAVANLGHGRGRPQPGGGPAAAASRLRLLWRRRKLELSECPVFGIQNSTMIS
jgi:hypothetical protein